jgi:threonine synthase
MLGPLEPVYDLDEIRPRLTREKIATGPPSLWRYGALLAGGDPAATRDSHPA